MDGARTSFAVVQIVGGIAVLGSYVHGFSAHADPGVLWGTIAPEVIPPYTACMPPAALGYLVAAGYLVTRVDPRTERLGTVGFSGLTAAFAVLLLASTLWMPLSLAAFDAQAPWLWTWIQVDLAATGGASLAIGWGLWRLREAGAAWKMAAVGWAFLCWQTVVLDCLVWPRFFVIPGT